MIRFLLLYLATYGAFNFYAWWKLGRLMRGHPFAQAALGGFIALMTFGPILVRTLERAGWFASAHALALVAYVWMAAVLWFVFLAGAVDLWNLGAGLAGRFWPVAARARVPLGPQMAAVGAIVALAAVWGVFEARWIRMEEVRLRADGLRGDRPVRVLQISDVHFGLLERDWRMGRILDFVERTKPDLIVSTGDLVDGTADGTDNVLRRLADVRPPLGKFAVTGNHEFYVGIKHSLELHELAGFRVLRGETVTLDGGWLRLAGVDDRTARRFGGRDRADEAALLGPRQAGVTTLLLKHQPHIDEDSLGRFDLQLSGHTHRGQIVPFNLFVRLAFKYLSGTHELGEGSRLHVSRGTGTWGPPMRLGSPPEVTLITIEPGGRADGTK